MKKIALILLSIIFSLSCKSQNIFTNTHGYLYRITSDTASSIIRNDQKEIIAYFTGSILWDENKKAILSIQENGDVQDVSEYFDAQKILGNISYNKNTNESKVVNSDGKILGHVYGNFGYIADDDKVKIAYADDNVNVKLASLLIFFYKTKLK